MKKLLLPVLLFSLFVFQSSAAFAATPIRGLIIKGGRNPGGNSISAVSDINGLIRFQGLKPGDSYTFNQQEFTVPESGILELIAEIQDGVARVIPFKGNRKGWDGTVKGGNKNAPKGGEDGSMKTKKETIVPLGKRIEQLTLSSF
jgi:hypothetical protein